MDPSSSAIKIENVWKVFGNISNEALDAIQNHKISPCLTSKETSDTPITELYFSKASVFEILRFWIASNASIEVLPNTFQTFSIFIAELDGSILSFIIGKYTRQYLIAEYKLFILD